MIELKVVVPDDWRVWRQLRLQALAEAPYAFGSKLADWQGEGDREERWRDRLRWKGSHNVIALLDGDPAGMASGIPAEDLDVELISMWVTPRGRGLRVADALVGEVERWANGCGAARLVLAVVESNQRARSFYRRLGFVDAGTLAGDSEGAPLEVRMEKPLPGDPSR